MLFFLNILVVAFDAKLFFFTGLFYLMLQNSCETFAETEKTVQKRNNFHRRIWVNFRLIFNVNLSILSNYSSNNCVKPHVVLEISNAWIRIPFDSFEMSCICKLYSMGFYRKKKSTLCLCHLFIHSFFF